MMKTASFTDVEYTDEEAKKLPSQLKEWLAPHTEKKGIQCLQSVRYNFPGAGKGKHTLSPMDLALNGRFMQECSRYWASCCDELNSLVYEYLARMKLVPDSDGGKRSLLSDSSLVYNALYAMSITRLRQWIEEDEDEQAEAEKKNKVEKATRRNRAFEGWVNNKNRYNCCTSLLPSQEHSD